MPAEVDSDSCNSKRAGYFTRSTNSTNLFEVCTVPENRTISPYPFLQRGLNSALPHQGRYYKFCPLNCAYCACLGEHPQSFHQSFLVCPPIGLWLPPTQLEHVYSTST